MKESEKTNRALLRKRAEEQLKLRTCKAKGVPETEVDMLKLIHELQVHQIELELQNEEYSKAKLEEELAKKKYASLYNFAPSAHFTLALNGDITELNLAGITLLGKRRESLINRNFGDFITRDTRDAYQKFLLNTSNGKTQANCEVAFVNNTGTHVFVHLNGILAEDGMRCLLTAVDITERKSAELGLRQSEAKYRQLAESSTAIVYLLLLKPDLKFDYVSPSVTAITGYTPEDHYSDPQLGFKLVHPDDRILLENTTRYSKGEALELRWIRKDGQVIWTEQRNFLLFDENNEPYAIEGNARDITDRKNMELGLRKEAERNMLLLDLFAKAPVLTDIELFDQALAIAVKITESKIGFFHQISDNQQEIILTTWNDEARKNCTTVSDNHYPLMKAGIWADCVRQRKPVVYNDYPASPNKKGLPEGHAPVGRTMSVPVLADEKVKLIFGVGNKTSDYTDMDVVQIQSVANELHKILEKRIIEKNLKHSEDRWQFAIEGSNDGIWDWNVLTDDVFFSNRWKEMIGYEPDELGGKLIEWKNRVHPDNIENVLLKLQEHFEKKTADYSAEHRMLCKDGSWKWILDRGKVLEWNDEGKPTRMVGTHTDITDRKNAEEVIHKSEEKFRIVADNAYNWEFWEGSDGRFIHHSPSCINLTGYSADEFLNNNDLMLRIIHPDDRQHFIDHHRESLTHHAKGKHFFRIINKEGEIREIEHVCQAVFNDVNTYIGIRGTNIDITERKLAENQLKESEVQYRNLTNAGSALLWTSGKDKLCNYFNEIWLKFTGRTLEQEMGNGWTEGVHPEDYDRCLETYVTAFDKQESFEMEYRLRHSSGQYKWIVDLGTPSFNSKGEFVGYIGHCFDISERKNMELELGITLSKYKTFFDVLPIGITVSDNDGNLLEGNQMSEKLLGLSNEEVIQRQMDGTEWKIVRPDGTPMPPDEFASVRALKENRKVENVEMGIVKGLHETTWISVSASPIPIDGQGVVIAYSDITHRKLVEDTQSFLLGCGLPGNNEDFFESLARYLSQTLNMDYVCIDQLEGDGLTAHTVAIYNEGHFESNVQYALKDTPCGEVVDRSVCLYRQGVRHLFPKDEALQDLNAESYVGTTLLDSKGRAIGLIAIIGHQPMHDESKAEELLKLVAPRAAGELERREAENALKETLEQLNQTNLLLEKRVEERTQELRQLSTLQQAILRHAGLAVISTSAEGLIEQFNYAAEEMLGYKANEVIGLYTPILFHDQHELAEFASKLTLETGEIVPSDFGVFQYILKNSLSRTNEWTYVRKGGDKVPVNLTVSSVKDSKGELLGYIGIAMDITREKQANKSIRESEERFHNMFWDHSAVMILVDPATGEILEANKAAEQFYGFAFNNGQKLLISDLNTFSPDQVKEEMDNAVRDQRNYFVFTHKLAAGDKRTVEVHSTPIEVSGNTVLFSIIHDITERRLAEEALNKSEAENRAIIQAVPDLMFRIKREDTFLDSQSQNESSLYVPKEHFVDGKVNEVLPPDLARQSMQAIGEAFTTGEVVQYEYSLAVQGKDHYFENRIIAISNEEVLSIIRDITDRKGMETALRMQSAAFESFALTIIITDIDGRIQWVNTAFTQLTGYSVDEAIGNIPGEMLGSGRQDKDFYSTFWETILSKKVWKGELINRRKDGSLYYEEETITPVLDSQGNISNFIAIKIDITERKKLYQELSEEKRRLADIIKGTNAGTWEWNVQTGKTIFNEQWAEIVGYTLDEISPINIETWIKFAHPDDLQSSGELLEKHFKGELDYYSFESRMKHKNGEWIWVLDRGKVHEWDSEGKPLLMSGTHQDITDWKNAEAEMLWNKSFLELMANSSPLGFLVVDNRTDDILYFNHRFCKIWEIQQIEDQMQRGELKNNDIIPYCLAVLADVPAFAESCKPLQSEANRIVLEDEIAFTENRTIRRFTTQIRGNNDEYFGRFYIFEDITERKQIEAEIRSAKSEAEKSNLAKSEFLSRMSHELRTPMNSILGFAQLMEMEELNPKQKKGVSHILDNGKHLLELINEVLDISGIEAGRQILAPEPVQLAGIISEMTDIVQGAAIKKQISIKLIDSPANNVFALADRLRLRQILINLLGNAIKYNKVGGSVTIMTKLQPSNEESRTQVRISISDTGNGIKPEDIAKLFQAFERIGADRTETEGTGLGLMVVKKLTEAMGGTVGVESAFDIGSTFWIELPLSEHSKPVTRQTPDSQKPVLPLTYRKSTVLYIEDNLSNIELVEEIIHEHRPAISLVSCMFGKKSLSLAKDHLPALILLDLNLPDMPGGKVLEQLMSDAQTNTIPVIVISADAMHYQIEKLLKAGAVEYLTKPLDVVAFLRAIDRYI